jgi:hypothetical protein
LALANLVLVGDCMASSPFGGAGLSNLGIQFALGPGAWVALSGAGLGVIVGFARLFAGRPALTRLEPTLSRPQAAAGS